MFSYFVIHVANELGFEFVRKEKHSQPHGANTLALNV